VPTYRLVVEYDGSAFHGLQFQPGLRTVAGELETALALIFHGPVSVNAAGRTDAGVHATAQVIAFRSERAFPVERLARAINGTTQPDIVVRAADLARDDFSARFDALERRYDYLIVNRGAPSALWRGRAWYVPRPIDDARLRAGAEPLLGRHDFVTFCGEQPERGGTERELYEIALERTADVLRIRVRGNGFLHHMVRIVVGSLVDEATGYEPERFTALALAARDRRAAGTTAPAHGLYLAGVRYPDFDVDLPVVLGP
jgi:tRNA pseudouridine38-40 synthase